MPISSLEREVPRLPRLGKIRLGIKATSQKGTEYPKKVDYFVCKADSVTSEVAAAAFHEVYGERPREIDIMFPVEDESVFLPTWFKAYRSSGLFCKGPGPEADGKPGVATRVYLGAKDPTLAPLGLPADLRDGAMVDVPLCDPAVCPYYVGGECKQNATIQVLLPQVKGLGVWQITTSSWNSIRNIRGGIRFIRGLTGGRIAWLPLKLRLVPQEVTHDGKKGTVYVMQIAHDGVRLADVLAASQKSIAQLLLPEVAPPDEDEIDGDQYPKAAAAAAAQGTGAKVAPAANGSEAEVAPAAPPSIDPSVATAMGALGWPPGKCQATWASWVSQGMSVESMHSELQAIHAGLVDEEGYATPEGMAAQAPDAATNSEPRADPPPPANPPARQRSSRSRLANPAPAPKAPKPQAPAQRPPVGQQSLLDDGAPLPPEPPTPPQRRKAPF